MIKHADIGWMDYLYNGLGIFIHGRYSVQHDLRRTVDTPTFYITDEYVHAESTAVLPLYLSSLITLSLIRLPRSQTYSTRDSSDLGRPVHEAARHEPPSCSRYPIYIHQARVDR
jgi:hypothetical protein